MRVLLLLPLAALAACSSFDSPCEAVNRNQADPALKTCTFFAGVKEEDKEMFTAEDGAPVAFPVPPKASFEGAFPDGSRLQESMWVRPGETTPSRRDTSRWVATSAVAPEADRYAISMRWDRTVRLVSASGEPLATVRVADGMDEKMMESLSTTDWPNRATFLAYSPDGATLYGTDTQGHVTAWDAASGETLWTATVPLDHGGKDGRAKKPDAIGALAPSDDGVHVAVATARAAHVLDAASGETRATWAFPKRHIVGLGFAEDGRHLVVKGSGAYVPPSVRYSNYDQATGRRTSLPQRTESGGGWRPPSVYLMAMP